MIKRWLKSILIIVFIVLCNSVFNNSLYAQNNTSDDIEVYLDFRHRGVINSLVITYYKDDQFYLPVSELFSLFKIGHTVNGLVIDGRFGVQQTPYHIDFKANQIRFGNETIPITADDYLIKELDSYLKADIFYEAFGLNFFINFNNLTLNLETERELPIIEQTIRQTRRRIASDNQYQQEKYELMYDRERPFIDGGFLDYNLSANITPNLNVYNLNTNIGMQVYGGDLQGSVFGSYSENFTSIYTDNLRWRYMFRDQPWLSKITIGQTSTDGVSRNSYTGIRISNEPVEPRQLFDEFEVQGSTIPESEVELYMNNALIDFQQADEMGNYRFLTPITYGSSQLNLKIYGPTGQIIERSKRIQIPFRFQPAGEFNYKINAGQLDNPILGNTEQNYTAQGNGAVGITDWLTAEAGVEYYQGFHDGLPTFTSSLSSRILTNYILTLEAVSEAYYRGVLNVIYPNSASINVDYTDFNSGIGIYNPSNDDKRLVASVFYPFDFGGLPFNLRASTFSRIRPTSSSSTFRLDANSRIGKINLRVGYSDRYVGEIDLLNPTVSSYLESSATYNIARNRNLPAYLRGVFLRAQMRYQPVLKQVESAEFFISRNIFQQGQFQVSFGRNFTGNYNSIRFSLVVDFNKVRTSSTFNNIRGGSNYSQNVRGSIGYDSNYNNVLFTSRDQVGRSGTAIQLFVDNNADGSFNEGDDPIEGNAVRVQRSGATSIIKNGVLYYTQMQPYYYYNMEMNKSAVFNPMLVPSVNQFGLITDPNRFKKVEIPFNMSGVIEGIVERQFPGGRVNGVAGLKLIVNRTDGDFTDELRTFSDGSFYAYEIPPGEYELIIDPANLEKLRAKSNPDTLNFEVKPIPEGDFIEGLNFLLVPQESEQEEEPVTANVGVSNTAKNGGGISLEYSIAVDSLKANECRYGVQLGAFSTVEAAKNVVQNYSIESSSHIVYNEPRKLYAVRTGLFNGLGDASNFTQRVAENYPGAAVLNQCYGTVASDYNPEEIRFDLQFAAFTNPNRADAYINTLQSEFELEAFQYQDPQSLLYKVRMGPFPTLKQAENRKSEILASTSISEIYISKQELPASMIDVDFEFVLQLGEFETPRKAALYAIRIEEEFDFTSKILIDENKEIILVAEQVYKDWEFVNQLRNMISDDPAFEAPVIHLMEIKNNKGFGYYWNLGDQTKKAMGGSK